MNSLHVSRVRLCSACLSRYLLHGEIGNADFVDMEQEILGKRRLRHSIRKSARSRTRRALLQPRCCTTRNA